MIYFIQQGEDGPIKIGRSENLARRMATMQIGNPEELRLLGVMPEEIELHCEFADLRMRGEWFRPDPRLYEFIQTFTVSTPPVGWSDVSRAAQRYREWTETRTDMMLEDQEE